ncbi:MAG: Bug family tripartite tricarboxylate transporter substrate binding protein [Gemmatimonas sp.]
MSVRRLVALCGAVALGFLPVPAAHAQQNDLFRGREIAVLIGGGPGGGADVYTRMFARHFGRYLPGNPSVVAKNVLGAGGLKLANQLYNVSPKDGTEIGTFLTSTALEPLFGNKEARFETTKFTWIGNMLDTDATSCFSWRTSGIKTWEDLKPRVTTFGASGPSALTSVQTKIVGELLGVTTKVIYGYTGGVRTSNLAMQRGELDATCGVYLVTVKTQFQDQIASGDLTVWMTFGASRDSAFPDVPTIYEVVKNAADRQLAELIFKQDTLGRPIAAPPGLPPDRTKAIRDGFMATMADPDFLAEAAKQGLDIHAMDGAETQRRYQAFYDVPKEVVERAKAITGQQPH